MALRDAAIIVLRRELSRMKCRDDLREGTGRLGSLSQPGDGSEGKRELRRTSCRDHLREGDNESR